MGETRQLRTTDGQAFDVYLAGAEDADAAVMILHEWWGVKPHNRQWAERLGELGYRTLVVDLYDGRTTDDAEQAGAWMREIDQAAADAKLLAALTHLDLERPGRRIASYGCSFGGKQSMRATLLAPSKVTATVVAYCAMENDVERLKRLPGPVFAAGAVGVTIGVGIAGALSGRPQSFEELIATALVGPGVVALVAGLFVVVAMILWGRGETRAYPTPAYRPEFSEDCFGVWLGGAGDAARVLEEAGADEVIDLTEVSS
jgi:dienelactone hydrolase